MRSLAEHAGTITAKVLGTRPYKVKLWIKDGGLEYSCTCPVGAEGGFCKHCVATGLAWLKPPKASKEPRKRSVTMKDVRSTLSAQSKEALVELVMDRAMDDDRLRQRLLINAATRGRKRINVATYRNAIDQAVDNDGFVGYREAYAYAEGISDVIDSIQNLLKQGHAEEVIELAEHGLSAVEEALNSVDDSGGNVGDLLERLQELHLAACRKARRQGAPGRRAPGLPGLGRRLAAHERDGGRGAQVPTLAQARARYFCVVFRLECPSRSCNDRRSARPAKRCSAKLCLKRCG